MSNAERNPLRRSGPGCRRVGNHCRDPAGKQARREQTGDNVGIQYGLKALLKGVITAEEFVTLNERVGGVDADSNRTASGAHVPIPRRWPIACRAGIVASGKDLGELPIIDSRGWDEQASTHLAQFLGARPSTRPMATIAADR